MTKFRHILPSIHLARLAPTPNDTVRGVRARWSGMLVAALLLGASNIQAADRSVEPIVSRIKREPVASSAVESVGYSRKLHALEIEFHDGLIYRYVAVPLPIYRELMSAESKARFYNQNIRGKYHCLRVKTAREP